MTAQQPNRQARHLALHGTYNVRDVGGYPTDDGRHTRWHTLFRADSLHRLSAEAQADLLAHGIRTIVDLRHAGEMVEAPNVFAASDRVIYVHTPLLEDPASAVASADRAPRPLGETYRVALETRGAVFVTILRRFVEEDGLPAVVHCTAGKDRTGLVIALALGAVGVDDETIAEDYALSAEYLVGTYFDEARERALKRGIAWEAYLANLVCPAPLMRQMLAWLRATYGSPSTYLQQMGLSSPEQSRLRALLTA
jgi:protein-tyrosine phosphatase